MKDIKQSLSSLRYLNIRKLKTAFKFEDCKSVNKIIHHFTEI